MSITIRVRSTQTFKLVISSELLAQVAAERAQAREVSEEKVATLKGHNRYVAEVMRSDRSDEEVLKVVFKDAIIETCKEGAKELNDSDIRVKGHQVVVEFPGEKAQEKPVEASQRCPLHDDSKACTSLCQRFLAAS